ncbi:MAG: DUF58 domain-containing protein [Candidatus Nanohaloarchaea archaeon]|nr:DUF58 domain-containing protein [Candidatus Nanohaloarchaea archaeon]
MTIEVDFLEELDRFNLAMKKHSIEIEHGEQKSNHMGQGMIFEDHKKYVPGDDIRKIDWNVYARTKEYFIKRFEEEKGITLHILVDRSSSMDYGQVNKYEYAAKLGLGLAYMATQTNNRFRMSVFSETVTDISSARTDANLASLVEVLNGLKKTPESLVDRCLGEYEKRIKDKSAVIIISDFLMEMEAIESGIGALSAEDIVLANVLDTTELNPDFRGDMILKDAESDSKIRTFISNWSKNEYLSELEEHTGNIEKLAHQHGAKYMKISTGNPFFDTFLRLWNVLNQ